MDYRDNEYDRMDSRYSGNRNLYCDLCFRRCRGVYHVIERGDTLYSLGKRYHVSVSDLMRANPYVNVYNLRIGEELCIPVRPQPRTDTGMDRDEEWSVYPAVDENGMELERNMPEQRNNERMMDRQGDMRTDMGNGMPEAVRAESRQQEEKQFSENDTIKEVLDKTGLSMSDFMEFLAEKMD